MDYRAVAKGEPIMTNPNNEFRPTCACGEEMKLITHAKGQTFVCECPLGFGIDVNLCTDCTKIIPAKMDYCEECLDAHRRLHMESLQKQADKYFEGKTKEEAIEGLCRVANGQCLPMYDHWLYRYGVEKFGITRADYYNDYDELTEEARMYIGENWKPNTGTKEERRIRLEADLKRQLHSSKNGMSEMQTNLELGHYQFFGHFASSYQLLGELIGAIQALAPRDGKYIWEL